MRHCAKTQRQLDQRGYIVNTQPSPGNYPYGHRHGGIEILLVHSGSVEIYSGDWQGHVAPGQAAVIAAELPHITRPDQREWVRTAVHFMPHVAYDLASSVERKVQESGGGWIPNLSSESVERILWSARTLSRPESVSTETAKALLTVILSEIYGADHDHPAQHPPVVREIIDYMKSRPDQTDSIDQLSRRFYVSKRQLHRLFQEHVGCGPHQYWLKLRIDTACKLLQESLAIKEVGYAVGFSSLRGFERAFQRVVGFSPREYRESFPNL